MAAVTSSKICFIDIDTVLKFASENSDFALGLCRQISWQMTCIQNKIASLGGKRMQGRLAEVLLYLSKEIFRSDDFEVVFTRKELGEMACMVTECVVRVIREFEGDGLIEADHGRIKILNKEKLEDIARK